MGLMDKLDMEKRLCGGRILTDVSQRYGGWARFLLADTNARVGDCPTPFIGDFQAETQDENGELLSAYVLQNDLWLPSTFEDFHSGDGGTWYHSKSTTWVRGDFVGLPASWNLSSCQSWVMDDVDLALKRQDHRPVAARIKWTAVVKSAYDKSLRHINNMPDSATIMKDLTGEEKVYSHRQLHAHLPTCDWTMDVHTHTALLQQGLQRWAGRRQRHRFRLPLRKAMTESTWALVQEKRDLRKSFFFRQGEQRRRLLRCIWGVWRHGTLGCHEESKEEAHEAARALHRLQFLSSAVTRALRQDDQLYFSTLLANMGDPSEHSVTTSTWKAIKWALPKVRQKKRQSPLLLATLDDQWHGHFAALEAGEMMSNHQLLRQCDQRQRSRSRGGQVVLEDLPTLVDVEVSLRRIEPHKAPGPDRISNAVFKYGAPTLSKAVHDVFMKSVVWEMEPVQNKGGLMFPIHKSGCVVVAKHYRGIMLLNTMAKCFHSILRKQVMDHLTPLRMQSQLGGFAYQQAQFGAQCIQSVGRICAAKGLSMAALFIDVRGAYHYLIRELVLGVESLADLEAVISALESEEADVRGVRQWSKIPGLLQRIGAREKLVSLLREVHQDTWAEMAHIPGTIRSRRGSRPGSPLADSIYHSLMCDVHVEVHRILEEDPTTSEGFRAAALSECAVTWADDLSIPVIVQDAGELVPTLQRITSKVHRAFEKKGLLLNMARNKTAAVLSFRGPSAPEMRRQFLLHQQPGCTVPISCQREVWLHFTGSYKHLGSIFCAEGHMTREVHARIGMASATYQQLRRPIFNNGALSANVKLQLLETLVLSQLSYGLATWNQVGDGLLRKIESFVLKCQRQVCRFRQDGTNDEFRGLFRLPTVETRLAAARLQYAARVWTVGPDILRDLLTSEDQCMTNGWLQSVRADLEWYQDVMGSRSLLLEPEIEHAALVWREEARRWKKSVKQAFRIGVMQEAVASDVRGWHHMILSAIHQFGGVVDGFRPPSEAGVYQCHCGKLCRSPQGLAAHQRLRHQQHGLEHPYVSGSSRPVCPVCNKWLWTKNRLRLHLAYIPRNGQPNRCFQVLQQSGWQPEEPMDGKDEGFVVPQHQRDMRLDALQCEGPHQDFGRVVDYAIAGVEEDIRKLQEEKELYVKPGDIEIPFVEDISGALTQATNDWWQHFQVERHDSSGDFLLDAWIGVLFEDCENEDEKQYMDVVFRGWGEYILPGLCEDWADGEAEQIAEKIFYNVVKEFRSFDMEAELEVKMNRLRALWRQREVEDEAGPHRPVRYGPDYHRGGRGLTKKIVRRYVDEDGWQKTCDDLRWQQAVRERTVPTLYPVIHRPCFLVLHLFSGRRRHGDLHEALMTLSQDLACDLKVVSLDTAVDSSCGDLSSDSYTWSMVVRLAKQGRISAAIAGPPCETYSEARFHVPEDLPAEDRDKWPRPLRTEERPWGVEGLRYREMKQLLVGNRFGLQTLWLFVMLLCCGGCMIIEHPNPTRKPGRAALFTMPIVNLLLELPEVILHVIYQSHYGARAVKPTGLLALRIGQFWRSMQPWKSYTPKEEIEMKIGRYRDGTFRTSELKEYPRGLSWSLAQCIVDSLKMSLRSGQWRASPHLDEDVSAWCTKALDASSKIFEDAPILPDYQERW